MNIAIFFGTETGNAEMLAEDLASALEDDHEVECANLADTNPEDLKRADLNILVCSTYGDGELPASARPFAERLERDASDLAGVQFAIFGLGDAEYLTTFTNGSRRLAEMLLERGATMIGKRATHDASGDDLPEDQAIPWARDILDGFAA